MKIWWRGHASFIIETAGKKIVTDPFDERLGYPVMPLEADLVTVSHDHWDHNAVETIKGHPQIVRGNGTTSVDGISIQGIASFHDRHGGRERGANTIFKITSEDLRLVHLGDLGHPLTAVHREQIGEVDILLIPVGGIYTIDAQEAVAVVQELQAKIVVPMHFSTPHLSFSLAPLEQFTSAFDQVIKKPRLEVGRKELSENTKIVVLDYLSK